MSTVTITDASPIPIRVSDLADFIHAPSPESPLDHEPDVRAGIMSTTERRTLILPVAAYRVVRLHGQQAEVFDLP